MSFCGCYYRTLSVLWVGGSSSRKVMATHIRHLVHVRRIARRKIFADTSFPSIPTFINVQAAAWTESSSFILRRAIVRVAGGQSADALQRKSIGTADERRKQIVSATVNALADGLGEQQMQPGGASGRRGTPACLRGDKWNERPHPPGGTRRRRRILTGRRQKKEDH